MPINYNPGITNNAAQYTFQGLQGLGQGIGAGIQDYMKRQQEEELKAQQMEHDISKADTIIGHAKGTPYLSTEDYNAYMNSSGKKRLGIAEGIAANMATDMIMGQNRQKDLYQAAQIANLGANTANTQQRTYDAQNPPKVQPLHRVPITDSRTGAEVGSAVTGGGLTQPKIDPPKEGQNEWKPDAAKIAEGKAMGLVFYPAGPKGNGYWVKDNRAPINQNTDVVKKFDEVVGRTYDITTKDLSQIDFRAPQKTNAKGEVVSAGSTSGGVRFESLDGDQISTEDAEKAGYKARAVVPTAEGKTRQVPYPEWKAILEKYHQLPRLSDTPGGVSVQGGNGKPSPEAVRTEAAQRIQQFPQLRDAILGKMKADGYNTDGL